MSSRAARTWARWVGSGDEVGLDERGGEDELEDSLMYLGFSAGTFFWPVMPLSSSSWDWIGADGGLGGRRGAASERVEAAGCGMEGEVTTWGDILWLRIC